ncbi:MAG: prepilin-type N-terminal cleavage/methylation domain-containing protein [Myxococcales bacterium]|nr:prepilin-type N-terminal cleavage/methylation domain-containing protein [Myxococcales bacterium]
MRPRQPGRPGAAGRGFTLIELMIALTISALLIGMILSIFTRMSTAYRTQQYVADLQRTLTAGHDVIQHDVRQAGFGLPDGWKKSGSQFVFPAVEIRDHATTPDELHVFYADSSAQARVMTIDTNPGNPFATVTVDNQDNFAVGDVVVITNYRTEAIGVPPNQVIVSRYRACVAQIAVITASVFSLRTDGTWGETNNDQCDEVRASHPTSGVVAGQPSTMVYRFVARGYRIDPTRRALGVLQLSPTGGVLDDWQDLGLGFTDLQIASRWYEGEDDDPGGRATADTADVDTDPARDWYSGGDQDTLTAAALTWDDRRSLLTEVRVTLVVRTRQNLQAVGAARTPTLVDATRPNNNDLGNRAAVTLAGVPDASRSEELRGDAIYRFATVGSDVRNLAVAR